MRHKGFWGRVRARGLSTVIFVIFILSVSAVANPLNADDKKNGNCEVIVSGKPVLSEAWAVTQRGLNRIRTQVIEGESSIHSLASVFLAREFAFLFGEGGGAKTMLARMMLEAELASYTADEKRVFVIQFHRLMNESVISGSPKINEMIKEGRFTVETSTSLVADDVILALFDEVEKANPATRTALLSVMNERKAFLGSTVVDSFLASAVATSNKNLPAFLNAHETDRPAGEAFLDRNVHKRLVPDQLSNLLSFVNMYRRSRMPRDGQAPKPVLGLHHLESLLDRVEVPEDVMAGFTHLLVNLDSTFTFESDRTLAEGRLKVEAKRQEYIPANQYSNRNVLKMLKIMKASFLVHQMLIGVPFEQVRFRMDHSDLVHASTGAIYGAPGFIRKKCVKLTQGVMLMGGAPEGYPWSVTPDLPLYIDPYDGFAFFEENSNTGIRQVFRIDLDSGRVLDGGKVADDASRRAILQAARAARSEGVEVEDDGEVNKLLQSGVLIEESRFDLEKAQFERNTFVTQLNAILKSVQSGASAESLFGEPLGEEEDQDFGYYIAEVDRLSAKQNRTAAEDEELGWLRSQLFLKGMNHMFLESEHAIKGMFVSLVAGEHVLAFGPPGGAKTLMAWTILKAALKSLSPREQVAANEIFFLQFHKLLPEGVITGFPKIEEQMTSGRLEYGTETSLINERYVFAILDEIEKGNPAVIQKLMSILEERQAFMGSQVVKAALATAIMTSNKTPAEFIASFGKDEQQTGRAFLRRAANKIYFSNKFSDPRILLRFLLRQQSGDIFDPTFGGRAYLDLPVLQALAKRVRIREVGAGVEDPAVPIMAAEVQRRVLALRTSDSEETRRRHRENWRDNPHEYVPASTPSNAAFLDSLGQWPAAIVVDRLAKGVGYAALTAFATHDGVTSQPMLTINHTDIILTAQGLIYWAPWSISSTDDNPNSDGVPYYAFESSLRTLKDRQYTNARQRYTQEKILEEMRDFISVLNNVLSTTMLEQREEIARHPTVFRRPTPQR